MDNRDTLLNAQFPPSVLHGPFLEIDLRDLMATSLLGRRGQLMFSTKLVFKAEDAYRKDQSVFQLWADVQVQGQDGVPLPSLGRAAILDPIFFGPLDDRMGVVHRDPWTRAMDRLILGLDHRQLYEIEKKRRGGPLRFTLAVGGVVQYGGRVGTLYAVNNQLTYEVSASGWLQLLTQLSYGTYLNIEVPLSSPSGLTDEVQLAARALQEAQAAFQRGDYEEAVADCRPGLDALTAADKGRYGLKPWDHAASKGERFYWVRRALLSVTHTAHHPNDPALANTQEPHSRWECADAEVAITILAALIRHRIG